MVLVDRNCDSCEPLFVSLRNVGHAFNAELIVRETAKKPCPGRIEIQTEGSRRSIRIESLSCGSNHETGVTGFDVHVSRITASWCGDVPKRFKQRAMLCSK